MSHDIVIAIRRPATLTMVESHLAAVGWRLVLQGDLAPDATLVAGSRTLFRRRYVFTLSGPHPAENEDFPAPVQRLMGARGFILEMNLPWNLPEADVLRAYALCKHLAMACDGAVFDPQDDRIVYPDLPDRAARNEPALTRSRELSLDWFLTDNDPATGQKFLSIVQRVWPEAMPTRFGDYEPLRRKLSDPDGQTEFIAGWGRSDAFMFWKSKKPIFGGSLSRSPDSPEPPGARRLLRLRVDINASAIEDAPELCDRAVELFAELASGLGAFFAAGYVARGVLVGKQGAVRYDGNSELIGLSRSQWWMGLPGRTTWLSWFGEPYRPLVAAILADAALVRGKGLLVRLGPTPMDSDQVSGLRPQLPAELLANLPPDPGRGPFTEAEQRPTPAAVIPSLE